MNVKQLIEKYKKLEGVWDAEGAELARQIFLQDLEQLDEPEKVKIPQFVADWIEDVKKNGLLKENFSGNRIGISVGDDVQRVLYFIFQKRMVEGEVLDWILDNTNNFARAWLDGYEVEEEPKYTVKFKATNQYLCDDDGIGLHISPSFRSNFRKSDLEKLSLTEVFDSPLFEVEEV